MRSDVGVVTGNDTTPPPTVTPPTTPRHPNLVWPTAGGINETEAERLCREPIVVSPAYTACSNFTAESMAVIVDFCKLDVQVNVETLRSDIYEYT